MSNAKPYLFDKKEIYEREVAPLVQQIFDTCKANGIPYAFMAQYTSSEVHDGMWSSVVAPEFEGQRLDAAPVLLALMMLMRASEQADEGNIGAIMALKETPLWQAAMNARKNLHAEHATEN